MPDTPSGPIRDYAPGCRPPPRAGSRNPPQVQNPPYPTRNAKNRAKRARRRARLLAAAQQQDQQP